MCSNSEVDPCGKDMIPLSFHTVKPDGQAQIVPNQSVKTSYATAVTTSVIYYTVLKCDVHYLEVNYYGLTIYMYCKIGMCSLFES